MFFVAALWKRYHRTATNRFADSSSARFRCAPSRLIVCAIALASFGCSESETRKPVGNSTAREDSSVAEIAVDDFGRPLPVDASWAERIVSLNPAATELIFTIGASDKLVGRSAWDEFPGEASRIPSAGDGIRPNVEAVLALKPTLVILYAAAENRRAVEAFERAGVKTMSIRVDGIAQFMKFTEQLGVAVGMPERARNVRDSVTRTLDAVRRATGNATEIRVVWPVWQSPVMVIGHGSYLDELLEIAGGKNIFSDLESPSPQVSIEEIARRNPDVIIAGIESQMKMREAPAWQSVAAVRGDKWITDKPAITGRPSVVLGMAAVMLARAMHPELDLALPPA